MIAALAAIAAAGATLGAPVSQLRAALGGQSFAVSVAAGGAAVLKDPSSGEHLTTISSSFSLPGPIWQNFSASEATADALGWRVTVDRSRAALGQWTVTGVGTAYRVSRLLWLDPPPPAKPRRLLVNDTITTPAHPAAPAARACGSRPTAKDVLGLAVRHQATVAASAADVDTAVIPGAYGNWQCSTHENPGDTCGVGCFDRAVKRTNNGRPDVFANRSTGGSSFGVGLAALDDVFRVHAQTLQTAMQSGPRMGGTMHCPVTSPPAIELSDPNLGLCKSRDTYTMEWVVYAFTGAADGESESQPEGCTDFFCFVNAQRADMASNTITMERTGFLGPASSLHGDMTVWDGTGCAPTHTPGLLLIQTVVELDVLSGVGTRAASIRAFQARRTTRPRRPRWRRPAGRYDSIQF